MTNKEKKHLQKVSRLLAKVLRHAPEELNLTLDAQGWVDTQTLQSALQAHDLPITADQLAYIVETSDKKRFTLSNYATRIRAAQGHSVTVDLAVTPSEPPTTLFHGTAEGNIESILRDGLLPKRRQQVHLSADRETALKVGKRHGVPVILLVDTAKMRADGIQFFQADNGVWLTDVVPPKFLQIADE